MSSSTLLFPNRRHLGRATLVLLAGTWLTQLAPGCGSGADTATDQASDTASSGSGSGGAGQVKGGGKKGSAAATAHQQGGSTAKGKLGGAANQGGNVQGIVCDESIEGVAWCVDGVDILFCYSGIWWLLDCSALADGAFCGYDPALNTVDCYVIESTSGAGASGIGGDGFGGDGLGGRSSTIDGVGAGPGCYEFGASCFDASECCSGFCDEFGACG